jgi:vacuolar protein-sorting-associated protein 4
LSERTDGYSCADLNILIRDASFQPLRKAQNATHFKAVSKNANGLPIYQPCPPSDPQGVKKTMFDISGDQLTLPCVSMVMRVFM